MLRVNIYTHGDNPNIPEEKQQENKAFIDSVLNSLFMIVRVCYTSKDRPAGLACWEELPDSLYDLIALQLACKITEEDKEFLSEKLQEAGKVTGAMHKKEEIMAMEALTGFHELYGAVQQLSGSAPWLKQSLEYLMGGMYFMGQASAYLGRDDYAEAVETYFWDAQLNRKIKEMEDLLKLHPEDLELHDRLDAMKLKVAELQGDIEALDRHVHRVHCEYSDVDHWATVPDCVEIMLDMLREDSLPGREKSKKISSDAVRVNIQKRLREAQVESRRSANADFYKTIDIAAESVREYNRYTTEQYLKEFNVIASPHNNLRRARKKRKV